jgi:general secretion pathway protein G
MTHQITNNDQQATKKTKRILVSFECYQLSARQGFTLVELIIAMVIIAILSATLWTNFLSSIAKGKDARRKQDLDGIAKALELYYNDKHLYPSSVPFGQPFVGDNNTVYMSQLPNDPAYPNAAYCYRSPTPGSPEPEGSYYQLYANLENTHDPQTFAAVVQCSNNFYYNYGIASPNVTP